MLRKTFLCFLSLHVFSALMTYAANANEQSIFPAQTYISVSDQTPVMVGDKTLKTVPLGTVVVVSRSNGNWRYSQDEKGWLHLRHLITPQDAITKFTAEIADKPTSRAYQLRGIAFMTQDEWVKAAQDFEKALDLGESGVTLHLNLGACYTQMGELASAIEEYDAILKTYPDDFHASLARGNVLLLQGQFAAALRDLEHASKLDPKSTDALVARGVSLRMLGRFEEAITQYDNALKIDPKRADALANRGYSRKALGDLREALNDYEAAVQLAPDSPGIRNDLAWLLATCPDKSIRNGERAVTLSEAVCKDTNNKNGEYLDTLAAAYASCSRFPAAIEAARLALTVMGDHPGAEATKKRLELYEKEQPYFENPASAKESQE